MPGLSVIPRVSVFGSTGSVGSSTVDVLSQVEDRFEVFALTGGNNVQKLIEQSLLLRPQYALILNESFYPHLKEALSPLGIQTLWGEEALINLAREPVACVISAISGIGGLKSTYEALKTGTKIGLANKESLVAAGPLILEAATKYKSALIPVDSEHSALFQVLEKNNPLEKIILTASGGPFFRKTKEELASVTIKEALKHPTWQMGHKISIDSATMMNKALELIEASFLFNIKEEKIDIVAHPESIVHSLIAYEDGSFLAQLSYPDMKIPISYALSWPNRSALKTQRLSLAQVGQLNFFDVDENGKESIDLARLSLKESKTLILNTVNEVCVEAFLSKKISFLAIKDFIKKALNQFSLPNPTSINEVVDQDLEIRKEVQKWFI